MYADEKVHVCVGVGVCVYVCASCLLVPGETDVLLLTALLSVWPLWRTAIQQTCVAWTIQLALRQSLKDPIVSALSNYGNLINLFCSSPLTAFVSAWDLLRDLCELHPIEGASDEGSALFRRNWLHFKEALKWKVNRSGLRGSVFRSFMSSVLVYSSLPFTKSAHPVLAKWKWSRFRATESGSALHSVVVSYDISISG